METVLILKLLLASALGAIVGFEREQSHKIAGLRTHALVALGAALFAVISVEGFNSFIGRTNYDPSRVIAAIITGIGFIGAGSILRTGSRIEGTTTAASLWAIAAIGIAVGMDFYLLAIVTTAIVYFILSFLWRIEFFISKKKTKKNED